MARVSPDARAEASRRIDELLAELLPLLTTLDEDDPEGNADDINQSIPMVTNWLLMLDIGDASGRSGEGWTMDLRAPGTGYVAAKGLATIYLHEF